ncbi:MAG TPA: GNAT family N-acetyltransferase [Rhizomicrobium sp.]
MPLTAEHDLSVFDCGKEPLNDWLKTRALKNEGRSSRCYVVNQGNTVVGYYTLSMGSVAHTGAPRGLKKNTPNPVPVAVIGRLAVDRGYHGRSIGRGMLQDALRRALFASQTVGTRAVIVHAIDDEVVPFYLGFDFRPFPTDTKTLWIAVETITAALP